MSDQHTKPKRSAFDRGADLCASAAGLLLTLALVPQFYHASIAAVLNYVDEQYGSGWDTLASMVWGIACAALIFAASLMTLAITLRLGFAKLGAFFFPHRHH